MAKLSIHRERSLPIIGASDRLRIKKRPKPTPENPLIVSASELSDFLRCRVKWLWRHYHRLTPIGGVVPLAFGGLGHSVMEGWYGIPEWKDRTTKAMRKAAKKVLGGTRPEELSLKDLELLEAMTVGYAAWARPRDRALKMRNVQVERWFDLPLGDGSVRVRGKIDVVFRQASLRSTMAALEHKFKAAIKLDTVETISQLSVYLWALRQLYPGEKRYIAHYNVLRKQMPGPRVKADLFAREAVERSNDEIAQWEIDTTRTAKDMLDAAIYPNPMESCSFDCDFKIPCLLRGSPGDLRHVLKSHYKTKDAR